MSDKKEVTFLDRLRKDLGDFFKNYGALANPLTSINAGVNEYDLAPHSLLKFSDKKDINYALWNALGTASWLVPTVALSSWLVNRNRHKKLKEQISKNTVAHVNADYPVLSPEGDLKVTANITRRPKKEVEDIKEAIKKLPKIAAGEQKDTSDTADLLRSAIVRGIPAASVPLITLLTLHTVNSKLKDKYAKELDDENKKVQNLQDAVDMRLLERTGYIKKDPSLIMEENVKKLAQSKLPKSLPKRAAEPEKKEDSRGPFSMSAEALKALFLNLPVAALMILSGGTAVYGAEWLRKRQNEEKKLKFLEEKALGRNRTLKEPEIIVELPKGYKENIGRKQSQIIPGIDAAPVVEDAQIVENPKKDVFLG